MIITLTAAKGIVLGRDANNYISRKWWISEPNQRLGQIINVQNGKQKATTVLKITPNEFADLREQYLNDIKTISKMEAIPKER